MDKRACCFTGHRKLPVETIRNITIRLNQALDSLIAGGVTDFISGGALGFDQLAASLVVSKKGMGKKIRLVFALPCKNQDALWTQKQRALYRGLLGQADEIIYVSQAYDQTCMKRRNDYMVENASHCICALLYERSGTGQTVRLAREKGLEIINVAQNGEFGEG